MEGMEGKLVDSLAEAMVELDKKFILEGCVTWHVLITLDWRLLNIAPLDTYLWQHVSLQDKNIL